MAPSEAFTLRNPVIALQSLKPTARQRIMMESTMKIRYAITLGLALAFAARAEAFVTPRHVTLASMDKNTRELFQQSMDLDGQLFDEDVKLVHRPGSRSNDARAGSYMVRESSWYALGLLLRDAAGDRQRAADILDAVLKQQYLTPGTKWYGTYRRTPEEPDPTTNPVMWRGYDPNWRVFIGTTFQMILIEYPDRISPELSKRLYEAIDHAIEGEMKEGRLLPSYSNIALMYGALWDFAAVHDKNAGWQKQSADWTESVYSLFKKYDAFFEYNSPTYYGVDLYGLALWRDYGSTKRIQTIGSEMEATLWKDIASFYNPLLRNVSGPYDRSYGMDMESYVSIVGVWMRTVLDAQKAPLPKIAASTDHIADVWFAPHLAILGTKIPPEAFEQMKTFQGDHLLHKQITAERVATAWIGRDVIFGGEITGKTKDAGTTTQFHPATVQWRTPSGEIGWVRLMESPMIDATADKQGLTISTTGTIRLRIHAKDMVQTKISATAWELPGLRVAIASDAKNFSVQKTEDATDLIYTGMTGMKLDIKASH
jgi:hypothetical protein